MWDLSHRKVDDRGSVVVDACGVEVTRPPTCEVGSQPISSKAATTARWELAIQKVVASCQ